jgi:hypothetical protein
MKRELVNKKTVDEKENDTKLTLRSSSDVYRVDHSLRIEVFQKWVWVYVYCSNPHPHPSKQLSRLFIRLIVAFQNQI